MFARLAPATTPKKKISDSTPALIRRCGKCGYYGRLRKKKRGEIPHYQKVAKKLYGLLVLPGLIYEVVTYNRTNYYCPDCRTWVC